MSFFLQVIQLDEYETGTIEREFVLEEIALIGEADIDKVETMEEVEYKIENDNIFWSVIF